MLTHLLIIFSLIFGPTQAIAETKVPAGTVRYKHQSAPTGSTPSGYVDVYCKSDDKCYKRDSTATETELGAGGGGSTKTISQTSHGFSVGDWLYYTGSSYAKAKADSDTTAEVLGVVSAVGGVNAFTLTMLGNVTGLSGLTAGLTYYLSAGTAGGLTSTEPSTVGHVSKPLLVADSTTSGYAIHSRGFLITSTSSSVPVSTSGTAEYINRAKITNNGSTASIADQSGSWISSAVRTSSAIVDLTLTGGVYSAAPSCTCSNTGGSKVCVVSANSSTSITIYTYASNTAALDDGNAFNIICMGPH
jgi:hypothetical protein